MLEIRAAGYWWTCKSTKAHIPIGSDEEVMVSNGGTHGLYAVMHALIEPGDEVLIPKPYWVTFPEVVVFARGTPVSQTILR